MFHDLNPHKHKTYIYIFIHIFIYIFLGIFQIQYNVPPDNPVSRGPKVVFQPPRLQIQIHGRSLNFGGNFEEEILQFNFGHRRNQRCQYLQVSHISSAGLHELNKYLIFIRGKIDIDIEELIICLLIYMYMIYMTFLFFNGAHFFYYFTLWVSTLGKGVMCTGDLFFKFMVLFIFPNLQGSPKCLPDITLKLYKIIRS